MTAYNESDRITLEDALLLLNDLSKDYYKLKLKENQTKNII